MAFIFLRFSFLQLSDFIIYTKLKHTISYYFKLAKITGLDVQKHTYLRNLMCNSILRYYLKVIF